MISPVWRERWLRWRNDLLANRRFQQWSAGFPLTRPVARRHVRTLFDLVAGFVYSQILSACVRLSLFDLLADRPLSIDLLAPRLGLSAAATTTLLKAAASLDLTELLSDGRYGLGPLGAALRGNPSVLAMILHHELLYQDLTDPVALLRDEDGSRRLAHFWSYAGNGDPAGAMPDQVGGYSDLMAQSQALVAGEILDAFSLTAFRRLMDVGGGEGVFLATAAARAPSLALSLFDLPSVVGRAQRRLAAVGLVPRTNFFSGNFLNDPLPGGADVISLVRVLHDHDDDPALALLGRIREALSADGVLLLAEPMSGTKGALPVGDGYFGFYLAAMGSGRPRSAAELTAFLLRAGFRSVRERKTRTPLLVRLLVARA